MTISQAVTLDISTGAATVGNMIFMQRESDGRQLDFTVLSNGVAYTLTGFTDKVIVIEKPDGEIIYNDLTNVTKNTAKYTFTSQSQIVKGLLRCWLKFTLGGQIVVTPEFHIRVNEVADFDTAAESTSEFGVLDRLIEDASKAVIECNEVIDEMNDMTESFENAIATATTLAEGASATVSLTDGVLGKEFAFGIPKGDKGDKGDTGNAATVEVGTVTTLDAGEPVTVVNSGDEHSATLNFGIPKGAKGDMGEVSTAEMNAAIASAISVVLTNLLTNGDFSNGETGWSFLSNSEVIGGQFVTTGGVGHCQQFVAIETGHDVIAICKYNRPNGGTAFVLSNGTGKYDGRVFATGLKTDGEWHTGTVRRTVVAGGTYLLFGSTNANTVGTAYADDFILIDLTDLNAALGRAVTTDEMIAIIDIYDGWFDGSVSLSWLQLIMTIINLLHP